LSILIFVRSLGSDRSSLALPLEDRLLVDSVLSLKKPTIIAIQTPAPVLLPFSSRANAVLIVGYAGQAFGNAIADVLSGDVNPSARLAFTWPTTSSEEVFSKDQWPGVQAKDPCVNECKRSKVIRNSKVIRTVWPYHKAQYSEGVFFGYRYYDKHQVYILFA
jgi:beta-glucosidase